MNEISPIHIRYTASKLITQLTQAIAEGNSRDIVNIQEQSEGIAWDNIPDLQRQWNALIELI